ncbi:MAG: glycosyltransferase [Bacteroidota bacterium]|nr:glycosyltransferase [Bacteroidota bacterium]
MKISIDVIIPSFRAEEKYLIPILSLSRPENAEVKFYIIIDNPAIHLSASIQSMADNENIFIIINEKNIGAAETRNKGIAAGDGDWILFLDDDVVVKNDLLLVYANAVGQYPNEIGFIGLINFPAAATSFTKAVKASGSMDIFGIASRKKSFAWAATANFFIKRIAIGNIKFSPAYPKSGGGEDVDFFLKVRKKNHHQNFKTLPQAAVEHPWWKNEEADFTRPFRYGTGNSNLGKMNPEYTYYDFLNTPETLFISLVLTIFFLFFEVTWLMPTIIFLCGVVIIEILASSIQTVKRTHKVNLKVMIYLMALRFMHESGVLFGKLSKFELWRIGERFHDDGTINRISFYRSNTYKTVKWILYPVLVFFILHKYF